MPDPAPAAQNPHDPESYKLLFGRGNLRHAPPPEKKREPPPKKVPPRCTMNGRPAKSRFPPTDLCVCQRGTDRHKAHRQHLPDSIQI